MFNKKYTVQFFSILILKNWMKNERFYLIESFFYPIDKPVYGSNRDKKRKVKKMKFPFFAG